MKRRALIMGWFSFELYGATAGDVMACRTAGAWLDDAGISFDVAFAPPFEGGVDWRKVDPLRYTDLVFVCGPFRESEVTHEFLDRFAHCRKTGLNLSMLQPLAEFNPFDVLVSRDSDAERNPDMSLLCPAERVPVVGLLLVHPQKEYGKRGRHREANRLIRQLLASRHAAVVEIDTRLDENQTGLRTAAEVESLIARMDVVVTTRLHGTVLALKNGVPAVVVDAIEGGAKVSAQAAALGWPYCFSIDTVTVNELDCAFTACLEPEARQLAMECADRGRSLLENPRRRVIEAWRGAPSPTSP